MKEMRIAKITGREILDSRGNPTIEADVYQMCIRDSAEPGLTGQILPIRIEESTGFTLYGVPCPSKE